MIIRRSALSALILLAACGASNKEKTMTGLDRLATCNPRSATLILIEEGLLTRTRVTAATAASHAPPIELTADDPRLLRLVSILKTIAPEPAQAAEFDPRTFVDLV